MVFVGEIQEFGRYSFFLQDVERSQPFADGQPIVQFTVYDHLRRGPVIDQPCRVPFFVTLPVVPEGPSELSGHQNTDLPKQNL